MQRFFESYTFIVAFVILVTIIYMLGGTKVTEGFLWLVLLSMLVTNANKFSQIARGLRQP